MANHHQRKPVVSQELALASDLFDKFCGATTLKTILSNYRNLCEILNVKPSNFPQFYPKLKVDLFFNFISSIFSFSLESRIKRLNFVFQQSKLCSWRAQALWNKFDKRANHKCYNRGKACPNTRVSRFNCLMDRFASKATKIGFSFQFFNKRLYILKIGF